MDRKKIDALARAQFCLDTNCPAEDPGPVRIHTAGPRPGVRIYDGMSSDFKAILYRGEAYIAASEALLPAVRERYAGCDPAWFCRFGNLRALDALLGERGLRIADTHVYLLPDPEAPPAGDSPLPLEWFDEDRIAAFREENPFPHALVYSPTQPDVIAVAARDGDQLIAMAGASADGAHLWQIGIDVDPAYRGRGLAAALVRSLRDRILAMDRLPFYGTSESHAVSMDVGIRAGFRPAWCEIFAADKNAPAHMPGEAAD